MILYICLFVFVTCFNDQTCTMSSSSLGWNGCNTNVHIIIIQWKHWREDKRTYSDRDHTRW